MENLETATGAVARTVHFIRLAVANGELVPGQRLVEPDLAALIGVSRSSLREAFRALQAEGLVSIERYKGASVRRPEPRELHESFEIRELLEGLAARRAAARAADADCGARFAALLEAMERAALAGDGGFAYGQLNREFHDLVLETADSEQLRALAGHLRPPAIVRLLHRRLLEPGAVQRSLEEHRQIIAALLAGDGARAEETMRRHIRSTMQTMPGLHAGETAKPSLRAC